MNLQNITLVGVDCIDLKRLQLAAEISCGDIEFGAVKLLTSIPSDDPRVVKVSKIKSIKEYSDFMIKDLYKYVDTEFALVFQHDGFVLNAKAWSNEFLKYDYIGSVWDHLGDLKVGNGGFSLRSKKLLDWLGKNYEKVGVRIHPEDVFISKFARPFLEKEGMKFAPVPVADKFSMEGTETSVSWNGEFGFHSLTYTDISKWLLENPEYKDRIINKLDDYTELMRKYPTNDGTVHTLKFKKEDKKSYTELSKNKKNYVAILTKEKYYDHTNILEGHTIVFKRSGISFKDLPIHAFEKKVQKVENFNSLASLHNKYPRMDIVYPKKDIAKWKRFLVPFFGDKIFPQNIPYTILWFE